MVHVFQLTCPNEEHKHEPFEFDSDAHMRDVKAKEAALRAAHEAQFPECKGHIILENVGLR